MCGTAGASRQVNERRETLWASLTTQSRHPPAAAAPEGDHDTVRVALPTRTLSPPRPNVCAMNSRWASPVCACMPPLAPLANGSVNKESNHIGSRLLIAFVVSITAISIESRTNLAPLPQSWHKLCPLCPRKLCCYRLLRLPAVATVNPLGPLLDIRFTAASELALCRWCRHVACARYGPEATTRQALCRTSNASRAG